LRPPRFPERHKPVPSPALSRRHSNSRLSLVVTRIGIISFRIKGLNPQRNLAVVEIGFVIVDGKILHLCSNAKVSVDALPAPEQILFRNGGIEHDAIAATVSCPDAEGSGRSLLYIPQRVNSAMLIRLLGRQLHIFEVT